MDPTGSIFAALDCDVDAIEDWNRWYDLEHTPMNVSIDGVMLSRRYVAPPELHAARLGTSDAFANGKATFLTTYVLSGDPQAAFDGMSTKLPLLYEQGRMTFPAEKKTVREGDVFEATKAAAPARLQLDAADVPFVGHTGVIVIQRRGSGGDRTEGLAEVHGVHGAWMLQSRQRRDVTLELIFTTGDLVAVAERLRQEVPLPGDTEVLLDAPYELIDPLRYPWADRIRASDLPKTVA